MPVVSVVVPFYNVRDYFGDLLESLRRQTHADLDVVLVDDGSTDGSHDLAARCAASDSRFRTVRQANQGAGPARNLGVREARGDFLAFADADDIVPLDAYQRMLERLLESGSDFVTARAGRFSSHGTRASYSQHQAIRAAARRVTIHDVPELGLDRMVWNKLYRSDFWAQHGFEYPAGGLQDYPVSSRAHIAARSVDVMTDWVYYWREREGGESSTTQRFAHLPLVEDRVRSDIDVLDVIRDGAPASLPLVARGFAQVDIPAMVKAVTGVDADHDRAVLELVQRLQSRLGAAASADLTPFHRILAHLVEAGDVDGLVEMNEYAARRGQRAVVVPGVNGRLVEDFPTRGSRSVPEDAFVPTGGTPELEVSIDDAAWREGILHLDLLIRTAVPLGPETAVTLTLEADDTVRELPVERLAWRRPLVGEDLAGIRTSIDVSTLDVDRFHALRVQVAGPHLSHSVLVAAPPLGRGFLPPTGPVAGRPRSLAGLGRFGRGSFGVLVRTPAAVIDSIEAKDAGFVVRGTLGVGRRRPDVSMQVIDPLGGHSERPVHLGRRDRRSRTRPFEALVPFTDVTDPVHDHDSPVSDSHLRRLALSVNGNEVVPRAAPDLPARYVARGARMAMAAHGARGEIELGDVALLPLIDGLTWHDDHTLVVSGRWPGATPLPPHVVLECFETPLSPERVELPVTQGPDGTFRVEVDVADLLHRQLGSPVHYEGRGARPWHLLVPFDDRRRAVVVDRGAVRTFASPRTVDGHRVAWRVVHGEVLHLTIR